MERKTILLQAAAIFSAALILIAALAWNNLAGLWFELYTPFNDPLASRLTYAIGVSIIAIFILTVLEPFRRIDKEIGNIWIPE